MEDNMDRYEEYVAGLKDKEGSPCIVCPEGQLEVSTFTKTIERDGTTLVVKTCLPSCAARAATPVTGRQLADV